MITRQINGTEWAGTPEQLDNVELAELLKGSKVIFQTERGPRQGVVTGHSQSGGGNYAWTLWLEVAYRGGRYSVRAEQVTY